jgi:hypothetical protein
MKKNRYVIITSIFRPTYAIKKFTEQYDWHIIVVGDKKTPNDWDCSSVEYLSVSTQKKSGSLLANKVPWNSYSRKIIGYSKAIEQGAEIIYDTDDDNIPLVNWINFPSFSGKYDRVLNKGFINTYSYYTDKKIWPRGFPLNLLRSNLIIETKKNETVKIGVWQYLANGDADVDAIYRLTDNTPVTFDARPPIVLGSGSLCPFNSQNTYFRKETFPLLYLPSTVSFRFTDILRGLIAQPIMWASGFSTAFGSATVFQDRNPHDYMDFKSEIPVYLMSEQVADIAISVVSPMKSIQENLYITYAALLKEKIVKTKEMDILSLWLNQF